MTKEEATTMMYGIARGSKFSLQEYNYHNPEHTSYGVFMGYGPDEECHCGLADSWEECIKILKEKINDD